MLKFPFAYHNGGLFLSRGCGRHEVRTIETDELILVISGTLDMFEEEKSYRLAAGDYLLLRHGRKHGGLSAYSAALKFYWHHFLPASAAAEEFLAALESSGPVYWQESVMQLSAQLLSEQQLKSDSPRKQTLLDALLSGMLAELQDKPDVTMRRKPNLLAEKAGQFLRLHYAEAVTTSEVAKELNCNADYLGRIFFQTFHRTIGDELRRLRIEEAKKLLSISKMPMKEVAEISGYPDLSYFHRQFFRETGMTPGAWQKQSKIRHVNTV